jgi:hypothetical protein
MSWLESARALDGAMTGVINGQEYIWSRSEVIDGNDIIKRRPCAK